MRKSVFAGVVLAALVLSGCNYSEQQRHARDYEQFLKQSLGTVEPVVGRAPQHAQVATQPETHVD
jgi:hypothetical protein